MSVPDLSCCRAVQAVVHWHLIKLGSAFHAGIGLYNLILLGSTRLMHLLLRRTEI